MREYDGLLVELWGRAFPGGDLGERCFDFVLKSYYSAHLPVVAKIKVLPDSCWRAKSA